jgi:uncharacterized Zn finger protein
MGRWYDYYDYFKPSQPREVKGGIKARSQRGDFGKNWWTRRWIAVLESFHIGPRLGRGKSYARKGQVISIDIDKGKITAKVQGSRARPYRVTIEVKTLTTVEWKKVAGILADQVIFAAKLLAGEMPAIIEDVFHDAGLSLFPAKRKDLKTDCSCPDWSNPCKHIAAVYYLLGEEFDRDPFLIFKLRGMEREELVDLIGATAGVLDPTGQQESYASETEQEQLPPEPLSAEPEPFWGEGGVREDLFGEVSISPVTAALPKRLGKFPFWRGEDDLVRILTEIYRNVSSVGMGLYLGEWKHEEG